MNVWSDIMLQIKELMNQLTANKPLYYAFLSFILVLFGILEIWVIQGKRKKDIKKIKQTFKQEEPTLKPVPKTKEQEQANLELQKVIAQMEKDLEKKNENTIRNFEEQQEESAIISYQELLEHTKSLKQAEISQIKESSKEEKLEKIPQRLERTPIREVEPEFLKEDDDFEKLTGQQMSRFKSTEFISPIYGRMPQDLPREKEAVISRTQRPASLREIRNQRRESRWENPVYESSQLELTRASSLEEENMRSDEFLNSLKEFRKNL